jgi:23S rRNA (cytosine1962-C5)-methyltransferase
MKSAWTRPAKAIAPGAVVNVRGEDGRAFGTGYFNPKSLIAVRLLAEIAMLSSTRFFAAAQARAGLRERLYDKPFYRLFMPKASAAGAGDRPLRRHLTVQIGTAGMERQLERLLQRWTRSCAKTVILRNDAPSRALGGIGRLCQDVKGEGRASRSRKMARAISPI